MGRVLFSFFNLLKPPETYVQKECVDDASSGLILSQHDYFYRVKYAYDKVGRYEREI